MELALIPVAALLLLLTTLGTPAHATAMGATAADVLRLLLTPGDEATEETAPDGPCVKTAHRRRRQRRSHPLLTRPRALAQGAAIRPSMLDKRSSRFVSASVAYRTTAPPAAR